MDSNRDYGYTNNDNPNKNYEYLKENNRLTSTIKINTDKDKPVRKSKKKYSASNAMCIRLPQRFGGKDRLKDIAKQQNKRYHTLAVDYIMAGIARDEKLFVSS